MTSPSADPHPADPQERAVDDPREPVTLRAGTRFTIRLPANPTTGYQWVLVTAPGLLLMQLDRSGFEPPMLASPGAAGTQVFAFTASRPGEETLRFDYLRPWESPPRPLEQRTIRVIVQPDPDLS